MQNVYKLIPSNCRKACQIEKTENKLGYHKPGTENYCVCTLHMLPQGKYSQYTTE